MRRFFKVCDGSGRQAGYRTAGWMGGMGRIQVVERQRIICLRIRPSVCGSESVPRFSPLIA